MNISHTPSSAYNLASNRAAQSLKNVLRKSSVQMNELQLMENCTALNSHVSMEGSGSNNDRFLGRSVHSFLPNSLNSNELIKRRINRHEHRMTKNTNKNKNNVIYQPGDRVMLKNVCTKDFLLNNTVESQRTSDDGQVVSDCIKTDKGFYITRHRRFSDL